MDEIECPYCEHGFDLCHDDGAYYNNEGDGEECECPKCFKNFMVFSEQTWDFRGEQADCLNGSEHKWRKTYNGAHYPELQKREHCEDCGKKRQL